MVSRFRIDLSHCVVLQKKWLDSSTKYAMPSFSSQDALQRHQKEQPYQGLRMHRCPECSYSTGKTGNLRCHLLTHTGEMLHACDQCHKRFSLEEISAPTSSCTRARRGTSAPPAEGDSLERWTCGGTRRCTAERPYRCSDCGKDLSETSGLKRHQRLLSRQRPYPCPHCEHRSTQLNHLKKNHIASTHSGVFRERSCPHCEHRSTQLNHLKNHIASTHSGVYRERCGRDATDQDS
ncbi:hypothetical protein CEXT_339931 [Caerostris extrusa]|uniref:C2H2-type domain-containing protein n=1 Tax=Caerostris extrusa TaxID=172846 RepID=A0AAV4NKN7_CAEEX|nr:hypothetical protein CEXT_339931 [Caerostris extrusa]